MITRFFRAFRSALLTIPFNPYAQIAELRAYLSATEASRVKAQNACKRLRGQRDNYEAAYLSASTRATAAERNRRIAVQNWTKLHSNALSQLEASEQANEAFMAEREDLKDMARAAILTGLKFAKVSIDLRAANQAISSELAEHVTANETLAARVAELEIERDNTLPFLQAVETKLASVGIAVEDNAGAPQVIVDSATLTAAIRARTVALAPQPVPADPTYASPAYPMGSPLPA